MQRSRKVDQYLRKKLLQELNVHVLGYGSLTGVVTHASTTCFQVDTHFVEFGVVICSTRTQLLGKVLAAACPSETVRRTTEC